MSAAPAIRVDGLGKRYELRHEGRPPYVALRDVLADGARSAARSLGRALAGRRDPAAPPAREEFWALRDAAFAIAPGERVGVVGRNGAGKSTLLKLLSRITEPTTGRIELEGRVASLLEVGTGFHPELTGRENVFLNGAILGMGRAEIRRKFDEIVAFAEVERFLDTPVKRYSSGMYVRLAFAVAAHLEPEILLVDEVLAVGDAQFQRKCLGRMEQVGREGRTVLFVSHNMAAVQHLCGRALLLEGGRVARDGDVASVTAAYLAGGAASAGGPEAPGLATPRPAWARPLIASARLLDAAGAPLATLGLGDELVVECAFDAAAGRPLRDPVMGVVVHHQTQGVVAGVNTRMTGFQAAGGPFAAGVFRCRIPALPLLQGRYALDLWIGDGPDDLDTIAGALHLDVAATDVYGTGKPPFDSMGVVFLRPSWELVAGTPVAPARPGASAASAAPAAPAASAAPPRPRTEDGA